MLMDLYRHFDDVQTFEDVFYGILDGIVIRFLWLEIRKMECQAIKRGNGKIWFKLEKLNIFVFQIFFW